jgi:hypothetical protein
MSMDLRYLKWDGIYSLDGQCNVVHEPIDTHDPASAHSRLRALRFDVGRADLADPEGKAASRRFTAMVELPANPRVRVRMKVTTSACKLEVVAPLTDGTSLTQTYDDGRTEDIDELEPVGFSGAAWGFRLLEVGSNAFAKLECLAWSNEEWKRILKFDSRTNVAKAPDTFEVYVPTWKTDAGPRTLFDEYPTVLGGGTLRTLAAMDDASITHPPPPAKAPGRIMRLFVSRSRATRRGSGAVVQLPDIAVKVRRTPRSLRPFVEVAFVQIKLTSAADIQSMMFRVYRSFDSSKGIGPMSAEQLVYQEVLDRAQIDALVRSVPDEKTWVAPLHPTRGGILRRQVNDSDGERFRKTEICRAGGGALTFDRSHAPYKFKVWVSTDAGAFDHAKISELPDPLELRRSSIDVLDDVASETSVVTPPPTEATVHDEARAGEAEDATASAADWPAIQRNAKAAAFRKNKFWTSRAQLGKNLCGTACAEHGSTFLADHVEERDAFVVAFQADAWNEYLKACAARKPDNHVRDFTWKPFDACCAAIDRHLARIEQRVCCGAYSGLPEPMKVAIARLAHEHRAAFADLRASDCPYHATFAQIESFVNFWNSVVAATTANDEYELHRIALESASPAAKEAYGSDPATIVNMRRNDISKHRMLAGGVTVIRDVATFEYAAALSSVNNSATTLPHTLTTPHDAYGAACTCTGELLLYPSYAPLTPRFFIAVRAAPLWVLALIDTGYILADRNYMQPYSFFEHDMFHATDDRTRQQWITMMAARDDHLRRGRSVTEVHELWQKNVETILEEIDQYADTKKALELMFFYLLHEPVDNAEDAAKAPAVPEKTSIETRLAMGPKAGYPEEVGDNFFLQEFIHKLDIKFFGRLFADLRKDLKQAYSEAKVICTKLTTTDRDV